MMRRGRSGETPVIGRGSMRAVLGFALVVGATLLLQTAVQASERDRLVEVLGLRAGMKTADVGAGDGEWTEYMAREVGPTGHVYSTEIEEDGVRKIESRARQAGLDNVTAILGTESETGLGPGCCDAILLRTVYHHFTRPAPMRASLRQALRPGARLAVVDFQPRQDWRDLPGVPDRGGHGIRIDELIAEMTGDGFEVVERHDDWSNDRFCVVFRRTPEPGFGEAAR